MIELEETNLHTIKDNKIKKLNDEDLEKYKKLVSVFEKLEDDIKFLYRGDDFSTIRDKLNAEDISDALSKIFTLGQKSNNVLMNRTKGNGDLFRIDRVSDEIFEQIFIMIRNVFIKDNPSKKLKEFILSDQYFYKFFKNINNKENFIKSLNNSSKRIFIKDYYMAFLHTVGGIISGTSYFLSTTESLDIAKKFAMTANRNGENNEIIFCYFITKPFISHGIFANNKGYITKEIEKNKFLPKYLPLYKKEEEFSIRGGFLPHYIFYVTFTYKRKKIILLNPYIFSEDFNVDNLLSGFPVDQENFIEILRTTQYEGYFEGSNQFKLEASE